MEIGRFFLRRHFRFALNWQMCALEGAAAALSSTMRTPADCKARLNPANGPVLAYRVKHGDDLKDIEIWVHLFGAFPVPQSLEFLNPRHVRKGAQVSSSD